MKGCDADKGWWRNKLCRRFYDLRHHLRDEFSPGVKKVREKYGKKKVDDEEANSEHPTTSDDHLTTSVTVTTLQPLVETSSAEDEDDIDEEEYDKVVNSGESEEEAEMVEMDKASFASHQSQRNSILGSDVDTIIRDCIPASAIEEMVYHSK